ncbi:TPA: phage tail protein [Klebsiella aerogenes]|nr:phage tail protein [Klebsiella aerogenes]HBY9819207.1 phage tail protein [Klebsiella aerogenes]
MNYKNLLTPISKAHPIELLGQQIFIRRLTQQELWDYETDLQALETVDNSARQSSIRGIELFLSALVNEDGSRPATDELPDAEAFLSVHSGADLLNAVITVQRHAIGTLEDAKKN